jgi:uncharacterized phiE125 gp8 family phage protein
VTIKQTTAPSCEPVTLGELKEHLRLLHSAQDNLLTGLITAARQRAEGFTRRAFITSTWLATWSRIPCRGRAGAQFSGRVLELPRGPLVAVDWLKYTDENGTEQTFASSNYTVDTYAEPGRLVLKPDSAWPTLGDYPGAVRIQFTAGYGGSTDAAKRAAVPEFAKLAIKFLAAHYYANPAPVNIGNITTELPEHVQALLHQLRIEGFGYGDEEQEVAA